VLNQSITIFLSANLSLPLLRFLVFLIGYLL